MLRNEHEPQLVRRSTLSLRGLREEQYFPHLDKDRDRGPLLLLIWQDALGLFFKHSFQAIHYPYWKFADSSQAGGTEKRFAEEINENDIRHYVLNMPDESSTRNSCGCDPLPKYCTFRF